MIDKYQTGVLSTTCGSPTDAISDCTLIVCGGILSQHLSSCLMDVCTVGHSVGFSVSDTDSVYHCNYVFVSEENDANII